MPTPSALEKELARHIAKALPQVMAGIGRPPEPSPEAQPAAYDTLEFCAAHRISRSQLYKLWRAGVGPRFMRLGKSVRDFERGRRPMARRTPGRHRSSGVNAPKAEKPRALR